MTAPFMGWKGLEFTAAATKPGGLTIARVITPNLLTPRPARMSRTMAALVLREMSTTFGRSPGGYLWAVIEPLAVISLLSFAFSLAFQAPSLGNSFPLFYATGYLPYMLFHDVSSKTAQAIRFSRPLLNFNAVTWMDVLLARFALNTFTHVVVGAFVLTAMLCLFETRAAPDLPIVLRSTAMAAFLALAVGILNAFLFLAMPIWERVWTIVTRPLFIVSGVFFLFEDLPSDIRDILWFNPVFHITGDMRRAFYVPYDASYVSAPFVFGLGFGLLCIALVLLFRHGDRMLNS